MARLQLNALIRHAEKLGSRTQIRANHGMVHDIYDCLNRAVFNGTLVRPHIIINNYGKLGFWGECEGKQRGSRWGEHYTKAIRIERNWPNMKKLITVMAHEMVHQWEWDKLGTMTHGNNFWAWQDRLLNKGIRLCLVL